MTWGVPVHVNTALAERNAKLKPTKEKRSTRTGPDDQNPWTIYSSWDSILRIKNSTILAYVWNGLLYEEWFMSQKREINQSLLSF